MRDRIALLSMCQVRDPDRGHFFVKLRPEKKKRYRGHPVYKDAFGRLVAIKQTEDVPA